MRHVLMLVTLCGCGESLGSLQDCLGDLGGTYEGAMNGRLDATLQEDGTLSLTFTDENGDVIEQGSGVVSEDGGLSGSAGDLDFNGKFDFSSCAASGDWLSNLAGGGDGTWELSQITSALD